MNIYDIKATLSAQQTATQLGLHAIAVLEQANAEQARNIAVLSAKVEELTSKTETNKEG